MKGFLNTVLSNQVNPARGSDLSRLQGRENYEHRCKILSSLIRWWIQHTELQEFIIPIGSSRTNFVIVLVQLIFKR